MKFVDCLPSWIVDCVDGRNVREIRLRNNSAVRVNVDGQWWCCSAVGLAKDLSTCRMLDVSCNNLVKLACNDSIYAYEQMLAEGYFTLDDGSRFGVAGAYSTAGKVFRDYTSICIRVPHCVDCANAYLLDVVKRGSALIVGAPATGKTTLLRDIAVKLSNYQNVAVVDERGELDVCNVLHNCDVLKWTSKKAGVEMALRCLSPNYILCDELARDDCAWLPRAVCSGVKVIATLHASSVDEVKNLDINLSNFKTLIICESVGIYEIISL